MYHELRKPGTSRPDRRATDRPASGSRRADAVRGLGRRQRAARPARGTWGAVMARRVEVTGSELAGPGNAQLYLAAALCIVIAILLTAIAVWHLDSSGRGERLAALPQSCCVHALSVFR